MSAQQEIPLRPMTLGELLDAAMVLLRRRALALLGFAAVLAVAEQVALAPVRAAAGLTPPYYGPSAGSVQDWWAVTAVGFGLEATIITLLAAMAGSEAGAALTRRGTAQRGKARRETPQAGTPHPGTGQPGTSQPGTDQAGKAQPGKVRLFRDGRWWATAGAAVLLGLVCALAAYAAFLPWIFAWGLFGLAGPVLTIDRMGNSFTAIGRSAALAVRNGLRGCWIMLAGYLTWFAVRFALGAGWTEVVSTVFGARPQWASWLAPLAWALADTVAYAALACVAAVLVLDIRMRTEGLDIAIRRAGPGQLVHLR